MVMGHNNSSRAAFVPECFEHPMEWTDGSQKYDAPVLGAHKCTHGAAVASWFFNTSSCERVLIGDEERPVALAKVGCNKGMFRKLASASSTPTVVATKSPRLSYV